MPLCLYCGKAGGDQPDIASLFLSGLVINISSLAHLRLSNNNKITNNSASIPSHLTWNMLITFHLRLTKISTSLRPCQWAGEDCVRLCARHVMSVRCEMAPSGSSMRYEGTGQLFIGKILQTSWVHLIFNFRGIFW